jgi:hypothetical protein
MMIEAVLWQVEPWRFFSFKSSDGKLFCNTSLVPTAIGLDSSLARAYVEGVIFGKTGIKVNIGPYDKWLKITDQKERLQYG